MDKIVLSNDDLNFLLDWRDKHEDLVRTSTCPLKKVKIVAPETGITLTCIRSERELTVSITQHGKSKGKLTFEVMPFGMYRLAKSNTNIYGEDDIQSVVTVYASTMALIAFGDDTEREPKKKRSSRVEKASHKPSKQRKANGIIISLGGAKTKLAS